MTASPIRVLLVDDHAVMRAGFRMILEAAGDVVVVGEASTGVEGVAAASALLPDVVCMDVQMPDMDGLEAAAEIRRFEAGSGRRLPIVALTAHAFPEDRARCLAAGMDDYLEKPIVAERLAAVLQRWVPQG